MDTFCTGILTFDTSIITSDTKKQYKYLNLRYSLPINIFPMEYVAYAACKTDGASPVQMDRRTYKISISKRKGRISYD